MSFPSLPQTWRLDDIEFNTGLDTETGVSRILNVSGWDGSSSGTPALTARVGGHGSYRGRNYRGSKVLDCVGWSQVEDADLRQDEIDTLSGMLLGPDTLFPLTKTLADGVQRTMWCELSSEITVTEMADGVSLRLAFQLVSPDPVKTSANNPTVGTGLPTSATGGISWNGTTAATGGTGIEWDGPASAPGTGLVYQMAAGTTGTLTLFNDGNVDAPIVFTIAVSPSGLAVVPKMTRQDTGERIVFNETVQPGSTVTINTGTGEAYLDGASRGGSLSGDLFTAPAGGSIDVAFTAGAGSSSTQLFATNPNVYS
jgi:hypothetical protein